MPNDFVTRPSETALDKTEAARPTELLATIQVLFFLVLKLIL